MNIDFSRMTTAADRMAGHLEEARMQAHATLFSAIERMAEQITGPVPLTEKLSWGAKEVAARAVAAGTPTEAQAAMILGEAEQTGETAGALADRVIRNADGYRAVIAALTGLRRRTEAGLQAAKSVEEVEATLAEAIRRLSEVGSG